MHFDDASLFSITLALFLIIDPVGSIPTFLKMVHNTPPKRRTFVIVRELLIAMGIMLAFNFLGEYIYRHLEISDTSVRIASGVILFMVSIRIIFQSEKSLRANLPAEEPFIVPLAIPLLAGPSVLATIMLFAHMTISPYLMITAIVIATLLSMIILLLSPWLKRLLGESGLGACEKLMGMILVFMAVQRLYEGLHQFIVE